MIRQKPWEIRQNPTSRPTKSIEFCGQPDAIMMAMTIDSTPSNSTHPQPCLGRSLNASSTLLTPLANRKAPISSARDAIEAIGNASM